LRVIKRNKPYYHDNKKYKKSTIESALALANLPANFAEGLLMNCNDKQLKFCIFIINQISHALKKPGADVYRYLAESGILDEYINGCYDSLHTLGLCYAGNTSINQIWGKHIRIC